MPYEVKFTYENGITSSLKLNSKFTCIYRDDDEEVCSHFLKSIEEGIGLGDIKVEVSDPSVTFTVVRSNTLPCILKVPEKQVILIDEFSMLKRSVIELVKNSDNLFICIMRTFPKGIDIPMNSIYRIAEIENKVFRFVELFTEFEILEAKDMGMGVRKYLKYLKKRGDFMKYYILEELKVGMTVSIRSLDRIVGVRILIDWNTFEEDKSGIGRGKIVFIGDGDLAKEGIDINECLVVYNEYEESPYDDITEFDEMLI